MVNMGRYLGQVAVVDKAGNVSNVQGDPDARTKMYAYNFSYSTGNTFGGQWRVNELGLKTMVIPGTCTNLERLEDNWIL